MKIRTNPISLACYIAGAALLIHAFSQDVEMALRGILLGCLAIFAVHFLQLIFTDPLD